MKPMRASSRFGVVAAVLAAALICTQVFGMTEHAVFATIAAGNVFSAFAMVALFARTQRTLSHSPRRGSDSTLPGGKEA